MGGIMLKRILSLFRNLLRKRAVEQALDDELRSSVEVLAQEKIRGGVSQSAARREALIELGGVEQVKEEFLVIHAAPIQIYTLTLIDALPPCPRRRHSSPS